MAADPAGSDAAAAPAPSLLKRLGLRGYLLLLRGIARLDPDKRPNRYLEGGFAPVHDERRDADLEIIEGQLPAAMDGAFLRVGPNPAQQVINGYHWFDGDGMVHAVRCLPTPGAAGRAAYSNHQVATARLRAEAAAGWPLVPKFGDYLGLRGLAVVLLDRLARALGLLDASQGLGCANTALVVHARRLLALHEGDAPYMLRLAADGSELGTLGRLTFQNKLGHSFTAHPKKDPETGELFFFGYSVERAPYCWAGRLSPDGELAADFPVPIDKPVMMHDCALTSRHLILLDLPLVFEPEVMVKERQLPFKFRKDRPARFGVLRRDATSADGIRWFSTGALMAFHVANAWEEGSTIKLYLCAFEEFSLSLEPTINGATRDEPYLSEVTLDLESGTCSVRRLVDVAGDFPQVPPALVGRPTRYTYYAAMDTSRGQPLFSGIAKADLAAADPGSSLQLIKHGAGRWGGEAMFVPDTTAQDGTEDAGFLVTYVHDEQADRSELVVYDARTMSSKPVCRVALKRRVPYGFHALWVGKEELATLGH